MTHSYQASLKHQLRNQLNTISVNAELIKLLAQGDHSPEQIITSVERILHECRQCSAILMDNDNTERDS